jgi:hypothetical protein
MVGVSLGRFTLIVGAVGPLLVGCAQPNPDTTAGRSDIAGQKCALCMATDPGDYWVPAMRWLTGWDSYA